MQRPRLVALVGRELELDAIPPGGAEALADDKKSTRTVDLTFLSDELQAASAD